MDFKTSLDTLGLNIENCVVIGSGILFALNIRQSNDIDVVTSSVMYKALADSGALEVTDNHGHEILTDNVFEIGTVWEVLGKEQALEDLQSESAVIDGVRYVSLEFLLRVKESWLLDDDVRQKDIDDVELIKEYLAKQS